MSTHTDVKIQHSRDGVWLHMRHGSQHFSLNLSAHETSRKLALAISNSALHQISDPAQPTKEIVDWTWTHPDTGATLVMAHAAPAHLGIGARTVADAAAAMKESAPAQPAASDARIELLDDLMILAQRYRVGYATADELRSEMSKAIGAAAQEGK